jgi:hypothetical protein
MTVAFTVTYLRFEFRLPRAKPIVQRPVIRTEKGDSRPANDKKIHFELEKVSPGTANL